MNHEISSAIFRTLPFLIVICVVAVLIQRKKMKAEDLDICKPLSIRSYAMWVGGFLLFTLLTEFVLYTFNILQVQRWEHSFAPSVILISGAILLAPVAEEFLFRGLILNVLIKKKINIHWAIIIQACCFVLLHNFTYENNLSSHIGMVQSLIDATLFGYARVFTKSIFTSITMHISGNIIAVLERFIL